MKHLNKTNLFIVCYVNIAAWQLLIFWLDDPGNFKGQNASNNIWR